MRSLIERFSEIDITNLTSGEINKYLQAISNDIINAYTALEEKQEMLEKINVILTHENETMRTQTSELYKMIADVQQSIKGRAQQHKSYYSSEGLKILTGEINAEYGYLAPLTETHRKINYSHYPLEFLISKFKIDLKIFKQGQNGEENQLIESFSIQDDRDLINLCNSVDTDFYLHSTTTETDADALIYELYIGLPQDIMPNLMINLITINPLLSSYMTLDSICYLHENQYKEVDGVTKEPVTKKQFAISPPIYTNNLKFVFSQDKYVEVNGKREFIFGLRDIKLDSVSTLTNRIEWVSEYKTLNRGQNFHVVYSPVVSSNAEWSDLSCELYLDKGLTQRAEFNTTLTANTDSIYIKYVLASLATQIPLVYGDQISYDTRISI